MNGCAHIICLCGERLDPTYAELERRVAMLRRRLNCIVTDFQALGTIQPESIALAEKTLMETR